MMSSKKMKKASGWLWFSGLLAISIGICFIFYNFGGRANSVMVIFYFLFFMVHGYRDIVFFYRPQTQDKALENKRTWILRLFQVCLILTLMYILVPAFFLYLRIKPKTNTPELQASIEALVPYLNAVMMTGWIVLLGSLVGLWKLLKEFPGGVKEFLA